jgi:hypothetical protein
MIRRNFLNLYAAIFAVLMTVGGADRTVFANQYFPEKPFTPSLHDDATTASVAGIHGLFFVSPTDARFPNLPVFGSADFQKMSFAILGEATRNQQTLLPEVAGTAIHLSFEKGELATPRASLLLSVQKPEDQPRHGFLPLPGFPVKEWLATYRPAPEDAPSTSPAAIPRGVAFNGLAYLPIEEASTPEGYHPLPQPTDPLTSPVVRVKVPFTPFILLTLDTPPWADTSDESVEAWAFQGVSPMAIRRLPDAKSGAAQFVLFPQYDPIGPKGFEVFWGKKAHFQDEPRPMLSEIVNRYELWGDTGLYETTRTYSPSRPGEKLESVQLMLPPNVRWFDVRSEPICDVEQLTREWARLTPQQGSANQIEVYLRGEFTIPTDLFQFPALFDTSISTSDLYLIERPAGMFGVTHTMQHGLRAIDPAQYEKHGIEKTKRHHSLVDAFFSRQRRPGNATLRSCIRNRLGELRRVRHEITCQLEGSLTTVQESLRFSIGKSDEPTTMPNPLIAWLPEDIDPQSLSFAWLDGGAPLPEDRPTTYLLQGNRLTMEWDETPDQVGCILSYKLLPNTDPQSADVIALPLSVISGRNVRLYSIAVSAESNLRLLDAGDFRRKPAMSDGVTAAIQPELSPYMALESVIVGKLTDAPPRRPIVERVIE